MNGPAIQAIELGKQYRVRSRRSSAVGSRRSLGRFVRREFWALRDVSFAIDEGEVIGLVGNNGAGKSTLLRILSRVTDPTSGCMVLRGRVGSLLEVGTGFHPELSGRENVFLSGAILGMHRREIERRFDDIVSFAEVERFIDTPVKHYSSGMYVRLGFSVAAHLDTDILLVDEVLAVGDARFQRQCLARMEEIAHDRGRTVVLVSHNMSAIANTCSRAIWLDEGATRADGPAGDVVDLYLNDAFRGSEIVAYERKPDLVAQVRSVGTFNSTGKPTSTFMVSDPPILRVTYEVNERMSGCVLAAVVERMDGVQIFWTADTDADPGLLETREQGLYETSVRLPTDHLNAGSYVVSVVIGNPGTEWYDYVKAVQFSLRTEGTTLAAIADDGFRTGVLLPRLKWDSPERAL